jgi:uncharacterized protein involved in oxidation of intracellular sulfur
MSLTLVVLNDPPYGSERSYNGLRLAGALAKRPGHEVRVFLMGDAAACANRGQRVPKGYYNVETMLKVVVQHGGQVGVCGSCMDARGIAEAVLAEGCRRGTLDELAAWTEWAERTLVF